MENVKEKDGPVNKCPAHIFKDPVAVDLNPDARVLEQEREYLLEELEEDLMAIDMRSPMPHVLTLLMRSPMKHMFFFFVFFSYSLCISWFFFNEE